MEKSFPISVPDVIAHRGFSAENPENTLISFENAIKAGTTALEGDIRLSRDNEIIMMHDLTLNRTTNGTGAVRDQDWHGYIDTLKTQAEPAQPIPRFRDVLDMLINSDVKTREGFYMIVDIKFDNPIEILEVLSQLLEGYLESHPELYRLLVIGIWNIEFLKKAQALFPKFKLCFIGISISAARTHFLQHVDYVSLPFAGLSTQDGQSLIKEVHACHKRVLTWTINDPLQMKTCVVWQVDGVIGDHVPVMIEHVRQVPQSLLTEKEYQQYKATDTYLASKRTRLYYYLMTKGMGLASWKWIGV